MSEKDSDFAKILKSVMETGNYPNEISNEPLDFLIKESFVAETNSRTWPLHVTERGCFLYTEIFLRLLKNGEKL